MQLSVIICVLNFCGCWIFFQEFCLRGRLIFGPDGKSIFLTIFLIVAPVAVFSAFVARNLLDDFPHHWGYSILIVVILHSVCKSFYSVTVICLICPLINCSCPLIEEVFHGLAFPFKFCRIIMFLVLHVKRYCYISCFEMQIVEGKTLHNFTIFGNCF